MTRAFLSAVFLLAAAQANAQPDLGRQDSWGDKEKQEFLRYLKSNQQLPVSGQVKDVGSPPSLRQGVRKARYLTLEAVSDSVFPVAQDDKVNSEPVAFGGRLIAGGHLFSWIRYYAGFQYSSLRQEKLDGTRERLSHVQVPIGLELALIPLGTPHTRYVLLRAGIAGHHIAGPTAKSDYKAPLLGFRQTWNLGLGYEWQIHDTPWRFHALAEGYKSITTKDGSRFYGLGATLGLARTF